MKRFVYKKLWFIIIFLCATLSVFAQGKKLKTDDFSYIKPGFIGYSWLIRDIFKEAELVCVVESLPIKEQDLSVSLSQNKNWEIPIYWKIRPFLIEEVLASKWSKQELNQFNWKFENHPSVILLEDKFTSEILAEPFYWPNIRYILILYEIDSKTIEEEFIKSKIPMPAEGRILRPVHGGIGMIPLVSVENLRHHKEWEKENQERLLDDKKSDISRLGVRENELPRDFRGAWWFWGTLDTPDILRTLKLYLSQQAYYFQTEKTYYPDKWPDSSIGKHISGQLIDPSPSELKKPNFPFLKHIFVEPTKPSKIVEIEK